MHATKPYRVPSPDKGLFLDLQPPFVPDTGFATGRNVKFVLGGVEKAPGYLSATTVLSPSGTLSTKTLNGVPTAFFEAQFYNGVKEFLCLTTRDIYKWDSGAKEWIYLTPLYQAGTVAVTNGSAVVTGTGTLFVANVKIGDKFRVDSDGDTWYTVDSITNDTSLTLTSAYLGTTGSGKAYTVRKLYKANTYDRWRARMLANTVIMTQRGDAPQKWSGTGQVQDLGTQGQFASASFMAVQQNKVLFANLTEGSTAFPVRVRWSDRNGIEVYTPGALTEAGFDDLAEGADPILAIEELDKFVIAYKRTKIYRLTDLLAPLFFGNEIIDTHVGLLGAGLVANIGRVHLFWSDAGLYQCDGFQVTKFNLAQGTSLVDKFFLKDYNPKYLDRAYTFVDRRESLVYFVYPDTNSTELPNKALVFNYRTQVWSLLDSELLKDITALGLREALTSSVETTIDRAESYSGGTVNVQGFNNRTVKANPLGSTKFLSVRNLNAGDVFKVDEDPDLLSNWIPIASIDDDDTLTLASNYPPGAKTLKNYTISIRSIDETYGTPDQLFFSRGALELWYAGSDGKTYIGGDYSKDGSAYIAEVETKEFEFGAADVMKFSDGMVFHTKPLYGTPLSMLVWVGIRNSLTENKRWLGPYPYPLDGTGRGLVDFFVESVFITFRFRTEGMQDPWFILGYEPKVRADSKAWLAPVPPSGPRPPGGGPGPGRGGLEGPGILP